MAALIAVMAAILLFLLMMPSQRFMEHMGGAADRLFPTTSSTTTSTTTTSTTTTSSTTTTTTTQSTSTTTTTSSTTSTMSGMRCDSDEDCGGTVEELRCKGNTIYRYTTTYRCSNRGTPESICLGRIKEEPVVSCEVYEDCVGGGCVRVYNNECDYRCYQQGYGGYYCTDDGCGEMDVRVSVDECSAAGSICCCETG